ncbi:MAG: ABC transporter ATP-binding protein [Candidatus Firestonebacteria bacterium RIFOXYC2_FULL_39_67]|nr:MAG: ABC transporter ATP-binding protein [Candidatus Firestonebacteria bacterium RIFOXYD2_FULL_39_29]OGF51958.1 MAG: ABC transporter ATP-binding protein [Candidatus Firestonebacteria bacterium RifOxyC12_full_39_7]OGF54848.1 MAG: ABC transporter ATP-binding protein [Candidatus Firestonebacteria bacterium RIFOXYC2_FULL_39_67]
MESIKITELVKKYDKVTAVNGINLTIDEGEIFGLLGPNGAGKTTTLMMLSTLLKPTSGLAIVNGYNVVTHPDEVRESIGMVFQDPSSDTLLTGYENLKLHALMYNLPWKAIDKKIESVLELVDLQKRKYDIVKKYSGGMRRRLEIARGLLHEPKIFFLDEPTLGLDPQTRQHIWEYIRALAKKIKMTIIVTTHYMEEAEKLCSRIGIVDHGKIVALDSPVNLIRSTGGDMVNLKGKNLNLKEIEKLPFVKGIKNVEGKYLISVENAGKNLQQLLSLSGEVEFVEVHSPDLNDVFLFYTGREMREAGEEVSFMQDAMRTS